MLLAVLVLVGITFLAMVNLRRRPYLMMGWLWFLGMLLPVSGLVQFGLQSIADRYTYLPSIGFFIMCVWAAAEAAEVLSPTVAVRILLPGHCRHGRFVVMRDAVPSSTHLLAKHRNIDGTCLEN